MLILHLPAAAMPVEIDWFSWLYNKVTIITLASVSYPSTLKVKYLGLHGYIFYHPLLNPILSGKLF